MVYVLFESGTSIEETFSGPRYAFSNPTPLFEASTFDESTLITASAASLAPASYKSTA